MTCWNSSGGVATDCDGWSPLARILNFAEQTQVFNAINFTDTPYSCRNSTAESIGLTMLWCPSDASISGLRFFEAQAGWDGTTVGITYGNYGNMMGSYNPNDGRFPNATELGLENGMYPDVGVPLWVNSNNSGATRSPVRIAAITDGTSNTIGFAETAPWQVFAVQLRDRRRLRLRVCRLVGRRRLRQHHHLIVLPAEPADPGDLLYDRLLLHLGDLRRHQHHTRLVQ